VEQYYSARRDFLYNLIFLITMAASLWALILVLLHTTPLPLKIVLALVITANIVFLWTVMTQIRYIISNDVVTAKIGPFSTKIPINKIKKVSRIKSLVSSFATSYHRLRIYHGHGFTDISPEDQNTFLEAIQARNPNISVV